MLKNKADQRLIMTSYLGRFLASLDEIRKISKDKRVDADVWKYMLEM